jgi:hypothetical protein
MTVAWRLFTKEGNSFQQGIQNLDFFLTRKRPPIWYVKIQIFTISWNLFPFKLASFNCQCTTVRYKQYQSSKLIIIFQHFTSNDKTRPQTFVAPLQTDIPIHYGGDGRQILLWKGKSIQLFIKSGDMSAPPSSIQVVCLSTLCVLNNIQPRQKQNN